MANQRKSYLLVVIQFAAILIILLTGPLFARQRLYLVGESLGLLIGAWAVVVMQLPTFTIFPDVNVQGRLTRHGPYRYIRHPMYLAVLLVTLALVLDHFSLFRWLTWVILLANMLYKIHYEERLLGLHYPEYITYQQVSKRLLPWIY